MGTGWRCVLGAGAILGMGNLCLGALTVSVATDESQYYPGQAMRVLVTAENNGTQDEFVNFDILNRELRYVMDDSYTYSWGEWPPVTYKIPAAGSYTWELPHNWRQYNLNLGVHSVVGRIEGRGNSDPAYFQVVKAPLPQKSFLLDFDTLPGSSTAIASVEEYWSWGVHFRSINPMTGSAPGRNVENGNGCLGTAGCTYPTGFNIVADFDMPVYGATMEVSTGTGAYVTLLAKDRNGQILDSVTSPTTKYMEFSGPLSVHSDQPIASLEWWPSQNNAAVLVDNLYVVVPEPGTLAAFGLGVSWLLSQRRRGYRSSEK